MPTYLVYLTQTTERTYRLEAGDPESAMQAAQDQAAGDEVESLIRERCSDSITWEVDGAAPQVTNCARG